MVTEALGVNKRRIMRTFEADQVALLCTTHEVLLTIAPNMYNPNLSRMKGDRLTMAELEETIPKCLDCMRIFMSVEVLSSIPMMTVVMNELNNSTPRVIEKGLLSFGKAVDNVISILCLCESRKRENEVDRNVSLSDLAAVTQLLTALLVSVGNRIDTDNFKCTMKTVSYQQSGRVGAPNERLAIKIEPKNDGADVADSLILLAFNDMMRCTMSLSTAALVQCGVLGIVLKSSDGNSESEYASLDLVVAEEAWLIRRKVGMVYFNPERVGASRAPMSVEVRTFTERGGDTGFVNFMIMKAYVTALESKMPKEEREKWMFDLTNTNYSTIRILIRGAKQVDGSTVAVFEHIVQALTDVNADGGLNEMMCYNLMTNGINAKSALGKVPRYM